MKKILVIALIAVFATITASAQDPEELRDTWQKTITVPNSQATIVEKLFTAWGKEFPGTFVEIFDTYKKTGKTDNQGLSDYKVDLAPKNGFIEIYGSWSMTVEEDCNFTKGDVVTREQILQAVYWNLPNGNKLFGVSIKSDGEIFADCAVMFYEYNVAKGTMTPRADIVKKVMTAIEDDTETFVKLPKEGRDLKYYDYSSGGDKAIKWNGNGF
ncbi:MAG: hypothetical protein IIT32_08410 [Bacteroidales bacterium]|nr:hypothetical protein [Bacteroidales bacterium]